MDEPTFDIPHRPRRRFSRDSVEYVGETVFRLDPAITDGDESVTALVETVLDGGPYDVGDWFDLPMPLFLVHDRETRDTFRIAVRDGRVELHVLPETDSAGLRAFYDRLVAESDRNWTVTCRTDAR